MATTRAKTRSSSSRGKKKARKLPPRDMLEWMYRTMKRIRSFEDAADRAFKAARMRGALHFYNGEEATATGVCAVLEQSDYITSTHRGHGHCIAKGGRLDRMMAELYGRSTGYCGGKGGSMHIADLDLGILGANGIVGAGIPIAAGAALGSKIRGEDKVTVCFFGDGALPTGAFHEGINFAAVQDLPVVYVCENNQYGMASHVSDTSAGSLVGRAANYGIPGAVVDGNDIFEVYETVTAFVERARKGDGPSLMIADTYRHHGHTVSDMAAYRQAEVVAKWLKRDPIVRFRREVIAAKALTNERMDAIDAEVELEIDEAIEFAEASPFPSIDTIEEGVYAD